MIVGDADGAANGEDRREVDRSVGARQTADQALRLLRPGFDLLFRGNRRLEFGRVDIADMDERRQFVVGNFEEADFIGLDLSLVEPRLAFRERDFRVRPEG